MLPPLPRNRGPSDGGEFPHADRTRALDLLKRYGWNATSFQVLEPGMQYWFHPDGDACVAFADTGRAWVVAGAPIGSQARFPELVARFAELAAAAGRRVCYFGTERRFTGISGYRHLPIGEQPVWDPTRWREGLQSSRSLREQLRRGRAKGVTVRALLPPELASPAAPVRVAIQQLISRWLRERPMAPMGFLVQVDLFSNPEERWIFVAERERQVIGFLALVPVYSRGGWLLEDLLRDPLSPNGTAELLVDHAMEAMAGENCRYATLGMVPLAGGVHPWLRIARSLGSRFYNFEGLRSFKARLRPGNWEQIYLSFPREQNSLLTISDALAAFAPQGLARFALETLVRMPGPVLRGLALLLIPWTLALAFAETSRWFPNRGIQLGWVLFDVALIVCLLQLSARWRPVMATLLAGAITADAVLTLLEVGAFNLSHAARPLDLLVAVIAVLAPTLAALFLWAVREYQTRLGPVC